MQVLIGLAVFLLAVNLAYIRFETFEHGKRIKEYALGKLGTGKDPAALKGADYYKRLRAWAGKTLDGESEHDEKTKKTISQQLGWWGCASRLLFDKGRDRRVANFTAWFSLITVLAGTTHASGQIKIPGEGVWIGVLWVLLEVLTVVSFVLVVAGNSYIARAFALIDEDAKHRDTFMSGRASNARTTRGEPGAGAASVREPRPPRLRPFQPRRSS